MKYSIPQFSLLYECTIGSCNFSIAHALLRRYMVFFPVRPARGNCSDLHRRVPKYQVYIVSCKRLFSPQKKTYIFLYHKDMALFQFFPEIVSGIFQSNSAISYLLQWRKFHLNSSEIHLPQGLAFHGRFRVHSLHFPTEWTFFTRSFRGVITIPHQEFLHHCPH